MFPPTALAVPVLVLAGAAVQDARTRMISDVFPLSLLGWAVASRLLGYQQQRWDLFLAGLCLGLALGFLAFLAGWLGGADGKLLAGLGAVLGPVGLLVALPLIAFYGGLAALYARRRGLREVAYAPAIALGYLSALLL
jgi:prepilin peptidase CpaA